MLRNIGAPSRINDSADSRHRWEDCTRRSRKVTREAPTRLICGNDSKQGTEQTALTKSYTGLPETANVVGRFAGKQFHSSTEHKGRG